MREYERWSTTTVNAYVRPLTARYLHSLESGLAGMGFTGRLLVMTASGGVVTPAIAREVVGVIATLAGYASVGWLQSKVGNRCDGRWAKRRRPR